MGRLAVYVIRAANGLCKIGIARCPGSRLVALSSLSPIALHLAYTATPADAATAEKHLHRHFAGKWHHGEWFRLSLGDVREIARLYPESGTWFTDQGKSPFDRAFARASRWAKRLAVKARTSHRIFRFENDPEDCCRVAPDALPGATVLATVCRRGVVHLHLAMRYREYRRAEIEERDGPEPVPARTGDAVRPRPDSTPPVRDDRP